MIILPILAHAVPEEAEFAGGVNPFELADITLILRRSPDAVPGDHESLAGVSRRPTEAEFERDHGAHPDELAAVQRFLKAHGVRVISVHRGAKQIKARATLAALNKTFQIKLQRYRHNGNLFRHHDVRPNLPAEVRPFVTCVVGLDNMPFRAYRKTVRVNPDAAAFDPPGTTPLTVQQVCTLYNFPTNSAAGQTVGIIEFSDSVYSPTDIAAFFSSSQTTRSEPTILTVTAPTSPADPNLDSTEANLDVCVCGATAAGVQIAMYNIPGYNGSTTTNLDILNTYTRIIFPQAGDPTCHIVSVSWGGGDMEQSFLTTVFQDAAAAGVTMCFSSGDTGSLPNPSSTAASISNSDPWMLICGGTVIGNVSGSTFTEWYWNQNNAGGGGGVSTFFPVPTFQLNNGVSPVGVITGLPGRGSPDISGNAAPDSGYIIIVRGGSTQVGGTSATTPMMAGLLAIINAANGKSSGYINPTIYANQGVFRDLNPTNTSGGPQNNSVDGSAGYSLLAGWDPLTGIGVPNGTSLKNLLAGTEIAPIANTVMSFSGGPVLDDAQITYVYWGSAWSTQTPNTTTISSTMTTFYEGPYFQGMQEYFVFVSPKLIQSITYTGTTPPAFGSLTSAQANTDFQTLLTSLFTSNTLTPPTIDNAAYMIVLPVTAGNVSGVTSGHGSFLYQGCPIFYGYVYGFAPSGSLSTLNQYTAALTSATNGTITNPLTTGWSGPGPTSTSSTIVDTEVEGLTETGEMVDGVWTSGFYSNVARDVIIPIFLPPVKSITIDPPVVHPGSAFVLSGSLIGYTSAPSLTYSDDGGSAVALPPGSVITEFINNTVSLVFSFSHPSLSNGTHTTTISDAINSISASVTYSVVTVPPTTLNPLDKTASITLSNNNYTATSSGVGGITGLKETAVTGSSITLAWNPVTVVSNGLTPQGVRATSPVIEGKVYFEVTLNAPTNNLAVGLSLDTFNLAHPNGLGFDLLPPNDLGWKSAGYMPTSTFKAGRLVAPNGGVSNIQSVGISSNGANAVVGVALNLSSTGPNVWFTSTAMQADGNAWNNLPSSQSLPDSGLNGYSLLFIAPGPYFPTFYTKDAGTSATFNFGASSFHFTMPAGYVAYDSLNTLYTTPSSALTPPVFLNNGTPATNTLMVISWQPPITGSGPFTYNLQVARATGGGASISTTWLTLVTSTSATTYNYAPLDPSGFPVWFRVQAVNGQGISPWSEAILSFVGYATPTFINGQSTPLIEPTTPIYYPATFNSNTVSYAKMATFPDPNDILPYISTFVMGFIQAEQTNTFSYQQFQNFTAIGMTGVNGFTNFNIAVVRFPDASFTVTPLTANTEYQIYTELYIRDIPQPQYFSATYCSLPGTSGYTGGFTSRLIPPGGVSVNWGGFELPMMPVGTTAHFAVYYDPTTYASGATGTSVQAGLEAIYTQYVTWFGSSKINNIWPAITTPINPVGALINVFLTVALQWNVHAGPNAPINGFAVERLGVHSGDFVCNIGELKDVGVVPFTLMLAANELAVAFLTNLSGTADGDGHIYGAGLAIAMAAELFPTAAANAAPSVGLNVSTFVPWAAAYLNIGTAFGIAPRFDFVNINNVNTYNLEVSTIASDQEQASIGCNALFNTYLVHQLGFTYTQICTAINTLPVGATATQVYNALNKTTGVNPFTSFIALLNANFPNQGATGSSGTLPSAVYPTFPVNPWPLSLTPPARKITITSVTPSEGFVAINGTLSGYSTPPVLDCVINTSTIELLSTDSEGTPTVTTTSFAVKLGISNVGSNTVVISDTLGTSATTTFTGQNAPAIAFYDHVVVVVMSGRSYNEIIGNTAQAPFINTTLLNGTGGYNQYSGGALLTNYSAITYPNEPNNLALYAGSTFGVTDNNFHAQSDPSLYSILNSVDLTFTGYVETTGSEQYNNPWEFFPEGTTVETSFSNFPTDFTTLPNVSFVIPGTGDNMQVGSITQGDTWLQNNIGPYATWCQSHFSVLVVVWNQDDGTGSNHVPCIIYGTDVNNGVAQTVAYNHYNLLATVAAMVESAAPNNAANAALIGTTQNLWL